MLTTEKKRIKTIAVQNPTYLKVLQKKSEFEIEVGRVLSMDKVINRLVDEHGKGEEDQKTHG